METNKIISSHCRAMSGSSQDSADRNAGLKQSQGLSLCACACSLHVKSAQAAIKFPCMYFIEIRDETNRMSICKGLKKVTHEQLATFQEVLEFQIEMLHDQGLNQLKNKQILVVLNLQSTRRPNQTKLVGRVTVNLADVYNKGAFTTENTYQLECCSVEAHITFDLKIINKVLLKKSIQTQTPEKVSLSQLKTRRQSEDKLKHNCSNERRDIGPEHPNSKEEQLSNDNHTLDEEVRKLQILCESIDKKREEQSCEYERVIENLESKIQSLIEIQNSKNQKIKAKEGRIIDLTAQLRILREVVRNSLMEQSDNSETEQQAEQNIHEKKSFSKNAVEKISNVNFCPQQAPSLQGSDAIEGESQVIEYWKQMLSNQKEQFELEVFKLNKLLDCSNQQLSANKKMIARMHQRREKSRQLLGVLHPEYQAEELDEQQVQPQQQSGNIQKQQSQPTQTQMQGESAKESEIQQLTVKIEELQEQLFRQLSTENTKELRIHCLEQQLSDMQAVLLLSNGKSPVSNQETSTGNQLATSNKDHNTQTINQYEERIRELQTCLGNTQKQSQEVQQKLVKQVNQLLSKQKDEQNAIESLKQELAYAHQAQEEKDTVLAKLNAEIKGMQTDQLQNQARSQELTLLTNQYGNLEAEHLKLHQQYSQLQANQANNKKQAEEELKFVRQTFLLSQKQSESLREQLQEQNRQLKAKTHEFQTTIQNITSQLEQKEHDNFQNAVDVNSRSVNSEAPVKTINSEMLDSTISNQEIVTTAVMLKELLKSRPQEEAITQALLLKIAQQEQYFLQNTENNNKYKSHILEKCRRLSLQLSKTKKQIMKNSSMILADKTELLRILKPLDSGICEIAYSAEAYCEENSMGEDQVL